MEKLKQLKLHSAVTLFEKEMKAIAGGSGDYPPPTGSGGDDSGGSGGICGAAAWTGDNFAYICNVSKAEAMDFFDHWNTSQKWLCCESCPSTWYCGNG